MHVCTWHHSRWIFFFFFSYVHSLFFHPIDYTKFVFCFFLISKMKTGKTMCRVWEEGVSEERAYVWGVPSPTTRLRWPWNMSVVAVRSQRKRERFPLRSGRLPQNWSQMWLLPAKRREEKAGTRTSVFDLNQYSVLKLKWILNAV